MELPLLNKFATWSRRGTVTDDDKMAEAIDYINALEPGEAGTIELIKSFWESYFSRDALATLASLMQFPN